MEIYKDIEGYEGKYQVSNYGIVKSLITNITLKVTIERNGYIRVMLSNGKRGSGIKHTIHRLVLITFKGLEKGKQCNHKDGDKTNNHVDNLEWCTAKENIQHAVRTGLKPPTKYWKGKFGKDNPRSKPVGQYTLDGELIKIHNGVSEAGRMLNIDFSSISKVCLGRQESTGGYKFKHIINE